MKAERDDFRCLSQMVLALFEIQKELLFCVESVNVLDISPSRYIMCVCARALLFYTVATIIGMDRLLLVGS